MISPVHKSPKLHWIMALPRTSLAAILGPALCLAVFAQSTGAPITLTFEQAMARARTYAAQAYSAEIAAQLAHGDRVQARAALLPGVTWFNQFIYTQPNG